MDSSLSDLSPPRILSEIPKYAFWALTQYTNLVSPLIYHIDFSPNRVCTKLNFYKDHRFFFFFADKSQERTFTLWRQLDVTLSQLRYVFHRTSSLYLKKIQWLDKVKIYLKECELKSFYISIRIIFGPTTSGGPSN